MKVSIVIPCYNAAPYIETTISSIQQQTLSEWEIIIVDDGSTDNCVEIIQKLIAQDNRIRLIQKDNGGSASARNLGLSLAQGDYIQFLDADDTIAPDKLARQTALMDRDNLDISYTDFRIVDADGTTLPPLKGYTFNLNKLFVGWGPLGTIPPHAFLYKHDFIKEITSYSRQKLESERIGISISRHFHANLVCSASKGIAEPSISVVQQEKPQMDPKPN